MPTYITLIKFTHQGITNIKEGPARVDAGRETLSGFGTAGESLGTVTFGAPAAAFRTPTAGRWWLAARRARVNGSRRQDLARPPCRPSPRRRRRARAREHSHRIPHVRDAVHSATVR
jgi:hypothetical protein